MGNSLFVLKNVFNDLQINNITKGLNFTLETSWGFLVLQKKKHGLGDYNSSIIIIIIII
jgi:hypothetical protein